MNTAIMIGDTDGALRFIEDIVPAERRREYSCVAFSYAAKWGRVESLRALWELGVDLEFRDGYGETPLMSAASGGTIGLKWPDTLESGAGMASRIATVRQLLEYGASLDARDPEGRTALDHAVLAEHAEIAELLRTAAGETE